MMKKPKTSTYSPEVRERAVGMVQEPCATRRASRSWPIQPPP